MGYGYNNRVWGTFTIRVGVGCSHGDDVMTIVLQKSVLGRTSSEILQPKLQRVQKSN